MYDQLKKKIQHSEKKFTAFFKIKKKFNLKINCKKDLFSFYIYIYVY